MKSLNTIDLPKILGGIAAQASNPKVAACALMAANLPLVSGMPTLEARGHSFGVAATILLLTAVLFLRQ